MKACFCITARCETQQQTEMIVSNVESIQKYHQDSTIVIVDSNSPLKDYMKKLSGVIIEDIKNVNYENGTIWHCFNKFKEFDLFVILQDSMKLNGSLSPYLDGNLYVYNSYKSWYCSDSSRKEWIKEKIKNCDYEFTDDFYMIQCSSMIIPTSLLSKVKSKKFDNIMPVNKVESMHMERMWGMVIAQEGVDVTKRHIEKEIIIKKFLNRQ